MCEGREANPFAQLLFTTHDLHRQLVKEECGSIGRECPSHGGAETLEPDLPVTTPSFTSESSKAFQRVPVLEVALHPRLDHILWIAG